MLSQGMHKVSMNSSIRATQTTRSRPCCSRSGFMFRAIEELELSTARLDLISARLRVVYEPLVDLKKKTKTNNYISIYSVYYK